MQRRCRHHPYTRAASDVYQDVFGEGSFIGKGIYEVDAFEQALALRMPENQILSHDLLEGCYARSGLLSDVHLIEEYPTRYSSDVQRRHRWIRGDWQLIAWLLPRVPAAKADAVRQRIRCRLCRAGRYSTTSAAAWSLSADFVAAFAGCVVRAVVLASGVVRAAFIDPFFCMAALDLMRKSVDLASADTFERDGFFTLQTCFTLSLTLVFLAV